MAQITDLPVELLLIIFDILDLFKPKILLGDLENCMMVCRQWFTIILRELELKRFPDIWNYTFHLPVRRGDLGVLKFALESYPHDESTALRILERVVIFQQSHILDYLVEKFGVVMVVEFGSTLAAMHGALSVIKYFYENYHLHEDVPRLASECLNWKILNYLDEINYKYNPELKEKMYVIVSSSEDSGDSEDSENSEGSEDSEDSEVDLYSS